MKKIFFSLLALYFSLNMQAQEVWQVIVKVNAQKFELKTDQFSAFTIRMSDNFTKFPLLRIGDMEVQPTFDEHADIAGFVQSNLIIAKDSILQILDFKGKELSIYFQNVPEIKVIKQGVDFRSKCDEPRSIKPEQWRAGLPLPKPSPVSTDTRHCIIHHSASGNGNTDYTSLVRNYYVQHTQVNGWDDIGYNYLIAFDGTIFIGRDKQMLNVPQYQVQGAHFCAKNSGTSGICLIGDFTQISPSDTMLGSLKNLVSWIFLKENIIATDSGRHPTPTDSFLPNIAGHRQGCATECPGENTFVGLTQLRIATEEIRSFCNQLVEVNRFIEPRRIVYDQDGKVKILSSMPYELYDLAGKKGKFTINDLPLGVYVVLFQDGIVEKIVKN